MTTPPSQQFPRLAPFFAALHHTQDAHRDVSDRILERADNQLGATDLFVLGVVKRSLDLVAAIEVLIERWNYSAMAPLVRLQVDSLLRLSYVTSTPNPAAIVAHLMAGKSFRDFRDEAGKKLTDARLLELAEGAYPWLRSMYEETSKVVHFTLGHLTMPLEFHGRPHVSVNMDVGLARWSEERIQECLNGTIILSSEILRVAATWRVA